MNKIIYEQMARLLEAGYELRDRAFKSPCQSSRADYNAIRIYFIIYFKSRPPS